MRNDEQSQVLRIQAYELRLRGKSWRAIGGELSIGHETARRWVKEHLDAVELPLVDEVRKTEVDRMMRYLDVLDGRIESGDDKAVSLAIKVSESLRKMLGADMPTQISVETSEVTQVDLEIADLIARQKALNALELERAADKSAGVEITDGESTV